ncbi:nitrous oxide reductase accessory protein NosL [Flavobacterium sedimenticola]|uniref:Nitrous oxide reductase accessory protein NosL n=1 Tax=Flavobacterium sedimenticola TaxID=3043286 RepID=A0ABT6XME3_9FLAO|nr:nitrous oxide reductase accessory protein NosL [Flavobacterium sedimenticola]MDI9256258.1 nitrous oxide reductase accessory protein NosL [Flavobacterium sedimenticola]
MRTFALSLITLLTLISCGSNEPKPIKLNIDSCDFCKMTIANGKFGAELITQKGRYYKFDDLACMVQFAKSNTVVPYQSFFVNDYLKDNTLISVESAFFIKSDKINSPMRGNMAAFSTAAQQGEYAKKLGAQTLTWSEVYNTYP